MLSPSPVSPLETPYSKLPTSASMKVLPPPFPPSHPGIPQHWGIKPSQDQGPLFPLMSKKAILCYMCGWNHGSLHVYSVVGGLVPVSSEGLVGWYYCSSYGVANFFSSISPFSKSYLGEPMLSPMVGIEHQPLYLSGSGRASQDTAISGFFQQTLLGIHNRVCIW